MHADESGRTTTASLTDMALIDDYNFSRIAFREMERNGRAHYTSAENNDMGVVIRESARELPFFMRQPLSSVPFSVSQHLVCGVVSGCPGHAAPGMCACTA